MKILFDIKGDYQELATIIKIAKSIKGFNIISSNTYSSREAYIRAELEYSYCFSLIGTYIVRSALECLEVQYYFIDLLKEHGIKLKKLEYTIVSISIDFKYKMGINKNINSYTNIFSYMDSISKESGYRILGGNQELLGGELQNIAFYNKSTKASLSIYSLFNRIKDKHGKNKALKEASEVPEILRDMIFKITIPSKINIHELEDFAEHNIYEESFKPFKENLLEFFNSELLEDEIKQEVHYYNRIFNRRASNFRWDTFIYKYSNQIRSYTALRKAMKNISISRKGLEQAVTKVRRSIDQLENMDGKIRINTIKTMRNMKNHLKSLEPTNDEIY